MRIELELDERTYADLRRIAQEKNMSEAQVIARLMVNTAPPAQQADPVLGMFSSEPALIDEVCEAAMRARAEHPMRIA